jgi:DNA-binding LytR/AlgR family response regulator
MRIYIAEDEPLAAQKLQFFLEKLGHESQNILLFDDGAKLVETLKTQTSPDLLFLDIQMPGMTGIEVLKYLQQEQKKGNHADLKVIITSAFDQYAIDGFNYGVSDYLLKPYTLDRLHQALSKVRLEPVINIRMERRTERLRVIDIVCMVAQKDYTQITLSDGNKLKTICTLSSFEQQLPPGLFFRVQRSYLVSLKHVKSYTSSTVILSTGDEAPIGRGVRESFIESLKAIR